MRFDFVLILFCLFLTEKVFGKKTDNSDAFHCKDDFGRDVDWFLAYKLPKIKSMNTNGNHVDTGLAYSFILPSNSNWQLSTKLINDSDSMIGRTLKPLYSPDRSNLAFLAYNDQPPEGPTVDHGGHSKGILMTSLAGGFWLQHSVPHFPAVGQMFTYPSTGQTNGQILFCSSLTVPKVDFMGRILTITKPFVYNYSIPSQFNSVLETLEQVVHKKSKQLDNEDDPIKSNLINKYHTEKPESHSMFQIESNGQSLTAFAKGPSFKEEVYADWIAPTLQVSLDVQSWLNGPNPFPSNCTSPANSVLNIDRKRLNGISFSTHNDHSKWGIAGPKATKPWVCIGDLNRMEHQKVRGGVVTCFQNQNVWNTFLGSIETTQSCATTTIEDGNKGSTGGWKRITGFFQRGLAYLKVLFQ